MNKKLILVCITVVCLCFTGCSYGGDNENESVSLSFISPEVGRDTDASLPQMSEAQEIDRGIKSSSYFNEASIEGKIKGIFYADDNNVIVYGDKLYLYDTQKDVISSQVENKYDIKSIKALNDGYVAVAMELKKKSDGESYYSCWTCIFYDKNLSIQNTISINDIVKENITSITVAKNSSQIAFASNNAVSIYNIKSKKTNQIINFLESDSFNGLCFIEELHFIDENRLFFKGGSFSVPVKENEESFPTYGMVNVDGGDFINKKVDNYNIGENLSVYDGLAIIPEFFMKASGRILKVDTKTGEETLLNLSSKGEGKDGVFCSDNGKYFATASLNNGLTVRVYETQNGKLVKEEYITDDNVAYFARVPSIKLLDDLKTCIVLLGERQNEIKTKTVTFGF